MAVADLDQTVDQDNSNSQSATTNLSFTASGLEPEIEDVEVEVEQEQEDIDQENINAAWNELTASGILVRRARRMPRPPLAMLMLSRTAC